MCIQKELFMTGNPLLANGDTYHLWGLTGYVNGSADIRGFTRRFCSLDYFMENFYGKCMNMEGEFVR